MNKLAIRPVEQAEIEITDLAPREPAWSWLPDEAPLAMPRQSLDAGQSAHDVTPVTSPRAVLFRRLALLAGTVALTGLSAIAPFYLYARKGWDPTEMLAFGIFMVLITAISCWFVSGLMGLVVLLRGKDQADLRFAAHPQTPRTRTAARSIRSTATWSRRWRPITPGRCACRSPRSATTASATST